nr:isoprenyl transferase [Segnochrobactrum spirostomi]
MAVTRMPEAIQSAATPDVGTPSRPVPPRHVAIIMDGNGRWAKERGLPRREGHRRGVEAVRRSVRCASERGIGFLTLFSFSSENWSRPPDEVAYLLSLLRLFIRKDLIELHQANVKVRIIGERDSLQPDLVRLLAEAETMTAANTGLTLVIAFNYGARNEIARAARRIAEAVAAGTLAPAEIDETTISAHLDTAGIPDPDLVIRTSGEQRISNFLLWQCAYSEFVFLPARWPDFDELAFDRAVADFCERDRRFGGLSARTGA